MAFRYLRDLLLINLPNFSHTAAPLSPPPSLISVASTTKNVGNLNSQHCKGERGGGSGKGQEPIWSVQLPYSVSETAFSQVGLFLD